MPMNKKWMPYTEDLGEMLNDSRAWCIAGDFTNLKIFNFDTYSCESEEEEHAIIGIEGSSDNVVPNVNDAQVLHRVCGIIDMIIASVPPQDPSQVPVKVLFADKESNKTFQECSAVHDRKFTFSCFDCANDACYVNDSAFHALVAYCIANPLPLSAAARAAASTPTSSTPNHSIAGSAGNSFVCPYSMAQCEMSGTEFDAQHKSEHCHCSEGVPPSLIAPLRHFVESVGRGEWPKAFQGQAPAKCCKPCDKLGLTAALKAVESTYVPLVYEPLCDVATVVYSTRCPCCPDVTYMVDKVVNMINRNRSRKQGESEWEPMWADLHSPCHSVSAQAIISTTSHPNSPTAITGKRGSFNDYSFEEADEQRASSLPLSSSVGSRPSQPQYPSDYPCLEGGLVSTRMRVVLCNIDENDLGSVDWPTEPCDQIVPHIRFYPACDLSEYSPLRPISRIRNGILPLGLPTGAVPTPPTALPMGSREYYQFLQAYDASKTASNGSSRGQQDQPAASPLSASVFQDKKNYTFGLKCEDRTAENVAKFFLSHSKRTIVSEESTRKIIDECRAIDAPKKRSRSDANMMILSPSGNALEEIGR
eukprot:GILI01009915.1.p1 GENE.GILI01009915.1~~GILI01009915.1.p1  ORF type:complete len:589 (+),score=79.33 GILI01009915.1:172-1938(+)